MQINDANKVYVRQPPLLSHEAGEADDEMVCMPHISQYQTLSLSLGDPYLHSDMRPYTNPTNLGLLSNSNMQYDATYLKAAQDLLDEFVNLYKPMKMVKNSKAVHESSNNVPIHYLSPSHCQDLRNKLFCMLDEVDRRFRQYEHEMQAVVSSFEAVAGTGAAIPYTLLALQTISRQFRRLRDAIKKHIQATQNVDPQHSGGVLSRLRRVDQQLREQKALQQLVAIRQPWRPQRGLPETAVTALRAWLFEHFLHPYPTDSEKMVLARETGLTRSQVANWFINARVRLWKPMIEEIYKEEFGGAELESLHETAARQISASDEREEASASLACMRLQHCDGDPAKHTAEKIECQGNDASSSSIIVDRLEHYYMGPGNNNSRFSNAPLLSDFVA